MRERSPVIAEDAPPRQTGTTSNLGECRRQPLLGASLSLLGLSLQRKEIELAMIRITTAEEPTGTTITVDETIVSEVATPAPFPLKLKRLFHA
jgi:hypothetical protein